MPLKIPPHLEFINCGPLPSQEDIEWIESECGGELHGQHRTFLTEINGGCFPERMIFDAIVNSDSKCFVFHSFWKYLDPRYHDGLAVALDSLCGNPLWFGSVAPLAISCHGDIVVSISEANFGAVLHIEWEHRHSDDVSKVVHIARDLETFFGMLRVLELSRIVEQSTEPHCSIERGDADAVEQWLKATPTLEARGTRGMTPLMCAVKRPRIFATLLSLGGGLELRDDQGNTVAHHAVTHGCSEVVRLLLERGVDFDIKNFSGDTPRILGSEFYLMRDLIATFAPQGDG